MDCYVSNSSEEGTVPFLDRSIYLAEYAACCPASAGAKSRSLISRVAAASSQQHDDDDDDGGGDGYSVPTMDQEAWTLDGWGDAPSVSDRAQYASNLLAKYSKDVPTTLLALSSPAGSRRAVSATSCGYKPHPSLQPTQCPRKGGSYRRRSTRTVRSLQMDARAKNHHSPTRLTLTSLEVGDESDVEPSASASANWSSNPDTDSIITDPDPRSATPTPPEHPVHVIAHSESGMGPPTPAGNLLDTFGGSAAAAAAAAVASGPFSAPLTTISPMGGGSSVHFVVQPCRNPRLAGRGHAVTLLPERSPTSLLLHRSGSLPGCAVQARCSSTQPTATPGAVGLMPLSFDPPPQNRLTLTGHSRGGHASATPAVSGTLSRATTLPPHRVDPLLLPLRTASSSSSRADVAGQILNSWLLDSPGGGLSGWEDNLPGGSSSNLPGSGSSNLLTSPSPKLMQHSTSFGLLTGVDAFSIFPHSQSQAQQQGQRNSGGGASSPSTLLQRMSHQPRLQDLSLMPDIISRPVHDFSLPRPSNQHTRHIAAAVAALALRRQPSTSSNSGSSSPAPSLTQIPLSPHLGSVTHPAHISGTVHHHPTTTHPSSAHQLTTSPAFVYQPSTHPSSAHQPTTHPSFSIHSSSSHPNSAHQLSPAIPPAYFPQPNIQPYSLAAHQQPIHLPLPHPHLAHSSVSLSGLDNLYQQSLPLPGRSNSVYDAKLMAVGVHMLADSVSPVPRTPFLPASCSPIPGITHSLSSLGFHNLARDV